MYGFESHLGHSFCINVKQALGRKIRGYFLSPPLFNTELWYSPYGVGKMNESYAEEGCVWVTPYPPPTLMFGRFQPPVINLWLRKAPCPLPILRTPKELGSSKWFEIRTATSYLWPQITASTTAASKISTSPNRANGWSSMMKASSRTASSMSDRATTPSPSSDVAIHQSPQRGLVGFLFGLDLCEVLMF